MTVIVYYVSPTGFESCHFVGVNPLHPNLKRALSKMCLRIRLSEMTAFITASPLSC